jgi:hypothetical protein
MSSRASSGSSSERTEKIAKPSREKYLDGSGLAGATPAERSGVPAQPKSLNLSHTLGGNIATAYFRPQLLPGLEFDTDR